MADKKDDVVKDEPMPDDEGPTKENSQEDGVEEESVAEQEKTQEEQIAELNDRFLRLYSEFDNYKRRTAKERLALYKTAGEDIIVSMLPVLDDFDRAMQAAKGSDSNKDVKEGIELIKNKLMTTLAQKGLEHMNSQGKPFDTDNHEAITKIPAPKKKLIGKVVEVIEKGFLLNGKVIRHAKVVVGS